MFQIRIHGRRGQGTVTAAQILSVAAFLEGRHAQAFPSFGLEHMGAPMVAFCRIADKEIRLREPVIEPDCLIVSRIACLRDTPLPSRRRTSRESGLEARGRTPPCSAHSRL